MAKRQSPSKRADSREMQSAHAMPDTRSPGQKLMDGAHSALSNIGHMIRMIDDKVGIPELKPHQAVFRQRVKNAVKSLTGKDDK